MIFVTRGSANIISPSRGGVEAAITAIGWSSGGTVSSWQMVAMSIGTTGKVTVGSVIKSLEVLFREGLGIGPGKLVVIPRNTHLCRSEAAHWFITYGH